MHGSGTNKQLAHRTKQEHVSPSADQKPTWRHLSSRHIMSAQRLPSCVPTQSFLTHSEMEKVLLFRSNPASCRHFICSFFESTLRHLIDACRVKAIP